MSDSASSAGATLPEATLTAAGSGRKVDLRNIGTPAILVFHGQDTADAALEVNKAVRREHPGADEVFIASIIDLRSFPGMFHGMVKPELEKAYFNAAGKLPEGADPADLVVILPDWDGAVHDTADVKNSTRQAVIVVADAQGRVFRRDHGDRPADFALAALAELLES